MAAHHDNQESPSRQQETLELACKAALESHSDDVDAYNNLAWVYARSDRVNKAIELLHRALHIAPSRADTHNNLGLAYRRAGKQDDAIKEFREAIRLEEDCSEAWFNLAQTLEEKNDIQGAEEHYRRLLKKEHGHLHGSINLGNLLCNRGDLESAETVFMEGLSKHPDSKMLLFNLGNTKRRRGDAFGSIKLYEQALASQDDQVLNQHVYTNLGLALKLNGDIKGSLSAHRKAFLLDHRDSTIKLNFAMTLFLNGDYEQGWIAYESRIDAGGGLVCRPSGPLWDGCTTSEEIILVAEQGIGDTIMFARYAECAKKLCRRVTLCVPPNLVQLLENAKIVDRVCSPSDVVKSNKTRWLPLLSLPRLLGVSPKNPLIQTPYLAVSSELVSHWSRVIRYQAGSSLIVGLCWQGNPNIEKGTFEGRSTQLQVLCRLSEIAQVRFVALQKGFGLEQLETCSFHDRFVENQEIVSECWDFTDTAAMIMACDVVISTDTAVAHLAAALGQECWLLLQYVPEWRWGTKGSSTPWYSSMKIFRQEYSGDWTKPVNEVYDSLINLTKERRARDIPSCKSRDIATYSQYPEQQHSGSVEPSRTPLQADTDLQKRGLIDKFLYAKILSECALRGEFDDEIARLHHALLQSSTDPEIFFRLGSAFREKGDFRVAIDCYRQVDALCAGNAESCYCLGFSYMKIGDLEASISWYRKCLDLRPHDANAWCNMAMALLMQGDLANADYAYRKAIAIKDDLAVAHTNHGVTLLLAGNYKEGLREFEWRWKVEGMHPIVDSSIKKWEGAACDVLLLVAEQGLGDSVQFMRYCKYLRDRVTEIHLCLPKKLVALAEFSKVADKIISPSDVPKGNYKDWMPLLSVLRILDVTPSNVLESSAYIKVPSDLVGYWGKKIRGAEGLTVGLHWQGNPHTETGVLQGRSLPLKTFEPLTRVEGIQFVSLQKGFGSEQLNECTFIDKFLQCQGEVDEAWTILDTAAIVSNCDIVITSDSFVAHLSGGLGVKTWLLLQKVPDWRWGMSGRKSPWYDSLSLYRQCKRGIWQDVIEEVAEDLRAEVNSRRSANKTDNYNVKS